MKLDMPGSGLVFEFPACFGWAAAVVMGTVAVAAAVGTDAVAAAEGHGSVGGDGCGDSNAIAALAPEVVAPETRSDERQQMAILPCERHSVSSFVESIHLARIELGTFSLRG